MTDDSRSERRDGSGTRNRKGFRSGRHGQRRRESSRFGYGRVRGKSGQGRRSSRKKEAGYGDRPEPTTPSPSREKQPENLTSGGETAGTGKDAAPQLPKNAHPHRLDLEIRKELRTLPKFLAELVARHLVAAGDFLNEDPERAYQHALYARRKASRVGAVREAAGIAAYLTGRWQEALSDLRAARRITGQDIYLPMIADCERGLGRPERALEIIREAPIDELDVAHQVELRIVASGARRDMGDLQGALVELQCPQLKERRARPWVARLFYAYADVLEELGHKGEAREYFSRASAVDREGVTDADERLAALEGLEIVDVGDDVVWSDAEDFALSAVEPEESKAPAADSSDQ